MVSVTVSENPGNSGGGAPRSTFHVAPPPPPRPRTWTSELAIALALALLFNLLVIASFLLLAPEAPSRQEPPSITVELVQEPKPEPPQPPQPEPEPQPEEKPVQERTFTHSGATDDPTAPGYGEEPAEEEPVKVEPQPEEKPAKQEQKAPNEDIPGWARTVEEGYDLNAGNQGAASAERQLAKANGGDAYLNAMGRRIVANLVYPPEARGREGMLVIMLLVSRTGDLEQFRIIKSTGTPSLDQAALMAIQRSIPFAPFPREVTAARAPLQLTLRVAPPKS